MKSLRGVRLILVFILAFCAIVIAAKFAARFYTSSKVAHALSTGVFPTAEEGMRQLLKESYTGITRINILYAGPNSPDGSQPHVWYVIAEIRAAMRADGSKMGKNECDAPGTFFIQTHEGWFRVSEGAFPELLGHWMSDFGLAGPGQSTPSIDQIGPGQTKFCQPD